MKNKLLSVCLFVFLFSIIFLLLGCPTIDKPPKLTIPDKTVDEGQVLQFDLKQYAEDKDKNSLAFTIVSGVGEIVGSDYRYAPIFDDSGQKEVKIRVTNAKDKSAEDTFKITVNDVNRPPMLDIRDQTMNEGETLTLNLNDYADDPDEDDLTFTLVSGVGEITGATYTYTPDYDVLKKVREYDPAAESIDFEVSISANDGKDGEATSTFTISVTDVNRPPVLDIPDQTINEGETLVLNLLDYTTDPDTLDTFTYTLVSGVGNIAGSTYTYTATCTDAGTKTVIVRVTDNKGGTDECEFSITVNDVNTEWTIEITGTDSGSSFIQIDYSIIPESLPSHVVVVMRSSDNISFSKLCALSYEETQLIDTNVLSDKIYFYELKLLSDDDVLDNAKTNVKTAEEKEVTYETSYLYGNVELPEEIDPTTLVVRNMEKVAPLDDEGNFEIDVKGDQVSVMFCSVPGYKIPLMTFVSPEVNGTKLQSTETINKETTAKSLLMLNPFLATPFPDSMARVNEAIEACSYLQTIADLIESLNNGESEVEDELIGAIESALDEIIEYLNEHYPMEEISPSGAAPVQITLPLVDAQDIGVRETKDVDLERVELSYTLEEIGGKTYYEVTPKIPGDWISVNSVVMLSELTETLTVEEMETFDHTRSIESYITGWPQIGTAQSETWYGWIDFIGKLIDLGVDAVFDYFLGEGKTSNLLIPAWEEGKYAFSSYGGFADISELGIFIEDLWETIQKMKEGEDIVYSNLPHELVSFYTMCALNGLDVGLTVISTIFNIRGLTEGEFVADVAEAMPEALRKGLLAARFELKSDLQDIGKWTKFIGEYIKNIAVESLTALSKAAMKQGVGLIIDAGKEFLSYITIVPKVMSIVSNASEVLARITSMVEFVSPRELAFITVSQEDNQPPVVTKVSGPSGTINQSSVTFSWAGDDSDGNITLYEYRKDEGSWTNHELNTSYTWNGYSEGEHTFDVRAQDNKGTYSEPVSWSFAYAAEKVIKSRGPSGSIATDNSVFEWQEAGFAGQEVEIVKYEYRKDGGIWTNHGLNTSYTWNGYSKGEHTFEVRAQDNGGFYSNTIRWDFVYLRSENHGGTLKLFARNEPATLNPLWAQETSSTDVIKLNHMSLLRADTGGLLTIAGLASEWWFADGGKTANFRVRESLQWSDGIPFTIEDVRWTFEDVAFLEENTANGNATYKDSAGYLPTVSVNGDVISFTWTEPNVWCYKAVGMTSILPKHILKEAVEEGRIAEVWRVTEFNEVVGMGPFLVCEFIEGVRIRLSRNPYYFELEPGGARLPYLDNVEFKFSNVEPQLLFEAGEIDVISPNVNAWQRIVDQAEEKGWIYGQGGPDLGSEFITFNFNNPDPAKRDWFRNPFFRRAFQYAMNKDAIIAGLFNGLGTAIYGPVSPSSGFFNPETLEAFPYKYSITRARLELKRGGFDWDDDGNLIDSEGTRVEFDLYTNTTNENRAFICNIIVDSAEKLGMQINLVLTDFNTLVSRLFIPDYDAILIGLTGSVDPGSGWNVWRMDGPLHFFNFTPETKPGVVDPDIYESFDWENRIHEIFVKQTAEMDKQKRWDLFAEFQMLVVEYQPLVYTISQNFLYAHKKTVHLANPSPSPAAGFLWGIESLWKD